MILSNINNILGECTDTSFKKLDKITVQATALWRRALFTLTEVNFIRFYLLSVILLKLDKFVITFRLLGLVICDY